MGRWVIALIVCAAGIAALQAHAQSSATVLARSVYATHSLPVGKTTTFSASCARGQSAVSGGVFAPAAGVSLLSLKPAGSRDYTFRFANPATNAARRVTVVVACRQLGASIKGQTPTLKLLHVKTAPVRVAAGAQRGASLSCPGRTAPAGSGQELGAGLSVRKVAASLHAWSFVVKNNGGASATAVFYGTCVTVLRPAGARRARLHISLTTTRGIVQPGTQILTDSCPRGWFSLATGYALPTAQLKIEASAAVERGGRWTVLSSAGAPVLADFQLACSQIRSS